MVSVCCKLGAPNPPPGSGLLLCVSSQHTETEKQQDQSTIHSFLLLSPLSTVNIITMVIKSILVLIALVAFFASSTKAIYSSRCKQYPDGRVTCVGPLSPDVLSDSEFSHCSMVGKRMICSGPALPPPHYRKPTIPAAALSDYEWSRCGKIGNRVMCTGPALPPPQRHLRNNRELADAAFSKCTPSGICYGPVLPPSRWE